MLGGRFLMGDTACWGTFEGNRLTELYTTKLTDTVLRADNYILATGSFLSRGLQSNYQRIFEPVLDVDVDAPAHHNEWVRYGVLEDQPYMSCGVHTIDGLHVTRDGKRVDNVLAVGSVLGGRNAVKTGDATGVALITALAAAHEIIGK